MDETYYKSIRKNILLSMIPVPPLPFIVSLGIGYYYFTLSLETSTIPSESPVQKFSAIRQKGGTGKMKFAREPRPEVCISRASWPLCRFYSVRPILWFRSFRICGMQERGKEMNPPLWGDCLGCRSRSQTCPVWGNLPPAT